MAPLVAVGERFSKRHRFTPSAARRFARAAGDTNPLHHDVAAAAASRYGALIVSGTHTTALLLGLAAAHFSATHAVVGEAFSVEFRRPVFMDAVVDIVWEVVAVTIRPGGVQRVALRGGVLDGQGEPCVHATGTVRLAEREPPPRRL